MASGKGVGVVGAGPAGLACAHRLAMHGHDVTIYEARKKSGGLYEYGIAAYKTVDNFAQKEVDFVQAIGGIAIEPQVFPDSRGIAAMPGLAKASRVG